MFSKSQTTIFAANSDGTINKNNYTYYQSRGNIIEHNDQTPNGSDTLTNLIVKIKSNKIFIRFKKDAEGKKSFIKAQIGYLTADNKIMGSATNIEPIDEAHAAYIKSNKVYSNDGKVLFFIEGKELYGAANYLLSPFAPH